MRIMFFPKKAFRKLLRPRVVSLLKFNGMAQNTYSILLFAADEFQAKVLWSVLPPGAYKEIILSFFRSLSCAGQRSPAAAPTVNNPISQPWPVNSATTPPRRHKLPSCCDNLLKRTLTAAWWSSTSVAAWRIKTRPSSASRTASRAARKRPAYPSSRWSSASTPWPTRASTCPLTHPPSLRRTISPSPPTRSIKTWRSVIRWSISRRSAGWSSCITIANGPPRRASRRTTSTPWPCVMSICASSPAGMPFASVWG